MQRLDAAGRIVGDMIRQPSRRDAWTTSWSRPSSSSARAWSWCSSWPGTRASPTTAEALRCCPWRTMVTLLCTVHGCRRPLLPAGRRVACRRGHSFDVARRGYLNLLQPQDRRARRPGDTAGVLAARRRFLESAAAAPLIEARSSTCRRSASVTPCWRSAAARVSTWPASPTGSAATHTESTSRSRRSTPRRDDSRGFGGSWRTPTASCRTLTRHSAWSSPSPLG